MRSYICNAVRTLVLHIYALILLFPVASFTTLHAQIATHVVISELYGGGGNAGSVYKNDFLELYNPTSSAVVMTNWSVQYASAAGSFSSSNKTIFSGTIASHGFFLIQEAQGSGGTTSLPTPDAVGTIAMSATNGKIALVDDSTTIIGISGVRVVDFVGFGTANEFEGSGAAAALSNTTSAERKAQSSSTASSMSNGGPDSLKGNGQDANDNSADFVIRSTQGPQNTLSPAETPPSVSTLIISNIARTLFVVEVSGVDTITANITSSGTITGAKLHVRVNGGAYDSSIAMALVSGSQYRGIIPASKHAAAGNLVEYFLSAGDNLSQYTSTSDALGGYFVGTSTIASVKSKTLSAILNYGARFSGTINVQTNTFSNGQGFMQDATGGIEMFLSGGLPSLPAGKNVKAQGSIVDFNGAYELSAPNFSFVDTALGSSTVTPITMTLPATESSTNVNEARCVKILALSTSSTGSFATGNYLFHNGTNDTITLRVESNAGLNTLIGTPIPSSPVDVIGVLSYSSGSLRLKPRTATDMGNTPILTFEAVNSGRWNDTLTWSSHKIPTASDNVTMTTLGVAVTVNIPNAQCNNLTIVGSGSGPTLGPTLKFDTTGSPQLTVNGALSISGGSGTGQGGRAKLTSNGNINATLVVKHNVVTTSSNSTSSGNAGLNMNEGMVKFTGGTADTLKNGSGLRLGNLEIGDGTLTKTLVWAPTKISTLSVRSVKVKNHGTFWIGSASDSTANDLGNATSSGVPTLTGGISVDNGASLLVQDFPAGVNAAAINLDGGGITNNGTMTLTASPSGSNYTINAGGLSAGSSSSTQTISGSNPIQCADIVVAAGDTLTLQQDVILSNAHMLTLNGSLVETPGNTIVGTIVATRVAARSVAQSFGGIGCVITAADAAPDTTTVRRVTGVASHGGNHTSILRYFDIAPKVNSGLNATLDFFYDASELAGQSASTLQLWKSANAGVSWLAQSTIADTAAKKLHCTGINTFSRWTAADASHSLTGSALQLQYHCTANWNLISIPLVVADPRTSTLFPSAVSPAFLYAGSYQVEDSLHLGVGYWLKFATADIDTVNGFVETDDTIPVVDGWNLIGTMASATPKSSITEIPAGIVTSNYFAYQGSYVSSDTLFPTRGYWVKTAGGGKLVLSNNGLSKNATPNGNPLTTSTALTFSDGNGNSQTLYLGRKPDRGFRLLPYELPPRPPSGVFDIRFASNRYFEVYSNEGVTAQEFPIGMQGVHVPLTVRWHYNNGANIMLIAVDDHGNRRSWDLTRESEAKILDETIHSLILRVSQDVAVPVEFSLSANYPNPFNPTTSLTLAVPYSAEVEADVVDLLGRTIASLHRGTMQAGYHILQWNGKTFGGSDAPSGMYIVRVSSREFRSIRKVLLLR